MNWIALNWVGLTYPRTSQTPRFPNDGCRGPEQTWRVFDECLMGSRELHTFKDRAGATWFFQHSTIDKHTCAERLWFKDNPYLTITYHNHNIIYHASTNKIYDNINGYRIISVSLKLTSHLGVQVGSWGFKLEVEWVFQLFQGLEGALVPARSRRAESSSASWTTGPLRMAASSFEALRTSWIKQQI